MMTQGFRRGARVRWNRGQGVGRGRIAERFERQVELRVPGALIRRNGSPDDPAYLVRTDAGDELLKLGSELRLS